MITISTHHNNHTKKHITGTAPPTHHKDFITNTQWTEPPTHYKDRAINTQPGKHHQYITRTRPCCSSMSNNIQGNHAIEQRFSIFLARVAHSKVQMAPAASVCRQWRNWRTDAVHTMTHARQVWPGSRELVHVKLVQILILSSPCPHWVNSGQFYSKQETGSIVSVTTLIFGYFCLF